MANVPRNGINQFLSNKPNRLLARIEQYFWSNEETIDSTNLCFYVFKPFPGNISPKQKKSWAALQSQSLSPFESGDRYYYVSAQGLHLWVSQIALTGIPETAAQTSLEDGTHIVAGEQHLYQQIWQDEVMLECIVRSSESNTTDTERKIDTKRPWAMQSYLQSKLKSPQAWILITTFIFLLAIIWYAGAAITLFAQNEYAAMQNQRLDPLVKGQLTQRKEFEEHEQILNLLQTWRSGHGYLPESLALIAVAINPLGDWEIKEISWQENRLVLQLNTGEMDIAALVTEIESIPSITSAGIKPHGGTDNFLLEASFND
ncbi:MAG: hypothetical protein P8J55_02145 [Pseudomonadales bacterium]|nr:hypothetical protein [Pseudomonadales bacterium]